MPACLLLQHGACDVLQGPVAGGCVIQLARIGPGVRDQFIQILSRQISTHHDDLRRRNHIGHRLKIAQVPLLLPSHMRRNHVVARVLHEQGVAIGRRALDLAGRNVAVAPAFVVHHDGLPKHGRQGLRQHAGRQVGGSPCGGGNHEGDRFAGKCRLGMAPQCGAQTHHTKHAPKALSPKYKH